MSEWNGAVRLVKSVVEIKWSEGDYEWVSEGDNAVREIWRMEERA